MALVGVGTPRLRQSREHCRALAGGLSVMRGPGVCDETIWKLARSYAPQNPTYRRVRDEWGPSGGVPRDGALRDVSVSAITFSAE